MMSMWLSSIARVYVATMNAVLNPATLVCTSVRGYPYPTDRAQHAKWSSGRSMRAVDGSERGGFDPSKSEAPPQ
jgi:hypothetical protein